MKCLLLLLFLSLPTYAQLPNTLGERKTLVILVNFQDKQEQPYTSTFVQGVLAQTNAYVQEASYQQTWLTTNVAGWFTIASSYTTCDPLTIASQAQVAATQAGFNVSSYSHLIYMFPANACPWTASATVGGTPTQMWKKGQPNFQQTTHEFGHNLGLWHSKSLDCGSDVICANGAIDEYGDHFDVMGSLDTQPNTVAAHFNLYQKEKLGWVNLTTVTAHGDYSIDNLAPVTAGSKGLKIAKSSGVWYYIEKRSAFGYDSWMNANITNGVLIHVGHEGEGSDKTSYLLDASPPNDWFDPALRVGQSFVDTSIDLGVTLLSVNASGAVVRVTCAACVPPPDTLSPAVSITAPVGTVPRNTTVSVQATASDNVGVDRVELLVNGVLLCTDFTAPYSCNWNVPGKKNATYTLLARAYDAAGNLGTHSTVVTAP